MPPGYDFLSLAIGSEGQFGVVTEATVRILKKPEGARPMMIGFNSPEAAGICVAGIIAPASFRLPSNTWTSPRSQVCEAFAKAGYPLDAEALLIVEVEGSEGEIEDSLDAHRRHRPQVRAANHRDQPRCRPKRAHLGRAQSGVRRHRPHFRLLLHGRHHSARPAATRLEAHFRHLRAQGLKVANIFHAGDGNLHPLILYDANSPAEAERAEHAGAEILKLCVEVGGCLTGEHGVGIEKRDLMTVQFSATDLAVQMRIKTVFDPAWLLNAAKVFPLEARPRFSWHCSRRRKKPRTRRPTKASRTAKGNCRERTMAPRRRMGAASMIGQAAARRLPVEVLGHGSARGIGRPAEPRRHDHHRLASRHHPL